MQTENETYRCRQCPRLHSLWGDDSAVISHVNISAWYSSMPEVLELRDQKISAACLPLQGRLLVDGSILVAPEVSAGGRLVIRRARLSLSLCDLGL